MGQVAVGGGMTFSTVGLNTLQIGKVVINQSGSSGESGWLIRVFNGNAAKTVAVTSHVTCVDAP